MSATRFSGRITLLVVLGMLALADAAHAQSRELPADTATVSALVRALIGPITAELVHDDSAFLKQRRDTAAWKVWYVAAPSADRATERAFIDAVLHVTGSRLWVPTDTLWTSLTLGNAVVRGDTAILDGDRSSRGCTEKNGHWGWGTTYLYVFSRTRAGWRYVRAEPYIVHDLPLPPQPGEPVVPCGT